jgi:hypothetical protein
MLGWGSRKPDENENKSSGPEYGCTAGDKRPTPLNPLIQFY